MKKLITLLAVAILTVGASASDKVYVKQYISILSDVGVTGIVPGTLIEHVKGDKYIVNGVEMELKPWQVTRSAREAALAVSKDSRAQAKLSAAMKAAIAESVKAEDAAFLEATEIAEKQARPVYVSPLGAPKLSSN